MKPEDVNIGDELTYIEENVQLRVRVLEAQIDASGRAGASGIRSFKLRALTAGEPHWPTGEHTPVKHEFEACVNLKIQGRVLWRFER